MAVYSIRKDGRGDFTTIAAFHAAAAPGDEGRIDDSETYNERVTITKNNIRIFAAPWQQPTWRHTATVITVASGVTGFTLEGTSAELPMVVQSLHHAHSSIQVLNNGGAITLRNLRAMTGRALLETYGSQAGPQVVERCEASGTGHLLYGANFNNLLVSDCRTGGATAGLLKANNWGGLIQRCYCTGAYITAPIASFQTYVGSPIVRNVHFRNTLGGSNPPIMAYTTALKVRECVFIRADKTQVGPSVAFVAPGAVVYENCVVKGFAIAYYSTYAGVTAITSHCDAWDFGTAGWGGTAIQQPTDRIVDPVWVDETTGQIGPGSPLINTGLNTGTPDDIRGVPRPQGAAYDRGVWEYEPPTTIYRPGSPLDLPFAVQAADLSGEPIPGFAPFDLVAETQGHPLASLARLALVSLFSDRTAVPGDRIPDGTNDPRGWWADHLNADGARIGSRLWLLMGAPVSRETAARAKAYAEEGLSWLVRDGIVTSVEVETEIRGSGQALALALGVTLVRGDGTGIRLTWPDLWAALEG